ncbi:hypothetical protein GVAV_003314 [Gurleya vavrai]
MKFFAIVISISILRRTTLALNESDDQLQKQTDIQEPLECINNLDNVNNDKTLDTNIIESENFFRSENEQFLKNLDFTQLKKSNSINAVANISYYKNCITAYHLNYIIMKVLESDIEILKMLFDPTEIISKTDFNTSEDGIIIANLNAIIADIEKSKTKLTIELEEINNFNVLITKVFEYTCLNIKNNEENLKNREKLRNELEEFSKLKEAGKKQLQDEDRSKYDLFVKLSTELQDFQNKNIFANFNLKDDKIQSEEIKNCLNLNEENIKAYKIRIDECDKKIYEIKNKFDLTKNEKLLNNMYLILMKDLESSNMKIIEKKNSIANQLKKTFQILLKKQKTYDVKMQNKNAPRGKPYRLKNFDIKNKDKTTIEKISFNSDIAYIDIINFINKAIKEIKTVFIKLEILKNKNNILQTFHALNLNNYKLLYDIKILNQNELLLNNNPIESVDVINNSLSKNKTDDITETEILENDKKKNLIYKRFFILQNEIKKILDSDDKIYYLYDFIKNIDKNNENFFFDMCHSELIYLIAEKLDDEEKSEILKKTIEASQILEKENNIEDKEDLKNSVKKENDINFKDKKVEKEELNKSQNILDQSTSSTDNTKDSNNNSQTNENDSNNKKGKPFYTKIWFIATTGIIFAFLIVIVMHFALKSEIFKNLMIAIFNFIP